MKITAIIVLIMLFAVTTVGCSKEDRQELDSVTLSTAATAAIVRDIKAINGGTQMAEQIDLSEFDFPEGTSKEAIHNTEVLYNTMQALTEKQLDKANFFFTAEILAEEGIVIAAVQPQDADENGYYLLIITDTSETKYYIVIHTDGGLSQIQREDGKNIYFGFNGEEPPLKWWQKLPAWLQWILRYILFGWAWMK